MKGLMIICMASSKKEAGAIKDALLEAKCAACVNIIEGAHSFFWWKGKIDSAEEVLLLIKAREDQFSGCRDMIKKVHSYEVPEIIAVPIIEGDPAYLNWLENPTS